MDRLLSMRVFARVVDEGGFAAAARSLDMSAPVVTRLVADLESHLGARLLQRSTRRVSLTEAGQEYLRRMRQILLDVDEADAAASAHTTELAGLLRVHARPTLANYGIAPLLPEFHQRYPKIQINIEVETAVKPSFENFDLALINTGDDFDADVVARKIFESSALWVASPEYLKRRGEPAQPEDLAQHDCLGLSIGGEWPRSVRLRQPGALQSNVTVPVQFCLVVNNLDTLLQATLSGMGVCAIAFELVLPYLTSGELVRVLRPWIGQHSVIYAVLPSRKFIPQRTRAFLDYLIEEMGKRKARAQDVLAAARSGFAMHILPHPD